MPKVSFDGLNKIINVTQAPVGGYIDLDVKVDLYSDWKEWVLENDNSKYLMAMSAVGGDPLPGSRALGSTFFLTNNWKIRSYESNHVLRVEGNLYCDDGAIPYVSTLGNYNVMVISSVSSLVDVVTTGGSALTQPEHDKLMALSDGTTIADKVWDEQQIGHVVLGTFGKYLDSEISGISVTGSGDWSDAERRQIRHRLGIDGSASSPTLAPSLASKTELDTAVSTIRGADSDTLKILSDQIDLKADGTSLQKIVGKLPMGDLAEKDEYNVALMTIQIDLDNPNQYKADVSGLALQTTVQGIKDKTDTINWPDIAFLKDIEGGRWRIVNNQMIFYKSDNATEVARFNLFNAGGMPSIENVTERQRV
jgi:hypothetical protein